MPDLDNVTLVKPTYKVYQLNHIFKVIKFKNTLETIRLSDKEWKHYDNKLASSLSRTRKLLLEKALCNPWEWFCTFTLDPQKYDRYDLPVWYKDFSQFLRDDRKRGYKNSYLLVPEMHKDGAWHIHGFMSGSMELISFREYRRAGNKVKRELISGDFYTWPRYQDKFGFCSFGRIKSPVRSAFYISKYISKDNSMLVSEVGSKMYYPSHNLNSAVLHGERYGPSSYLDRFLEKDYDFCKMGMTKVSDHLDWTFGMDFFEIDFEYFQPVFDQIEKQKSFFEDMAGIQFDQLSLYD